MDDIFWAPDDSEEYRLLRDAATSGDEKLLDQALQTKLRLDALFGNEARDEGQTALHMASDEGHLAIVEKLLANGAAVDVMERDPRGGNTPLFYAAQHGHAEVVKCLLTAGARTDIVTAPHYNTVLDAVMLQPGPTNEARVQTLSVLLDHGVDVNVTGAAHHGTVLARAIYTEDCKIIHFLQDRGISFKGSLATALWNGKRSVLHTLIDAGAMDDEHEALAFAVTSRDVELIENLLQCKEGAPSPGSCSDLVSLAVRSENIEAIKLLLAHGFALNKHDKYGLTPLHQAFLGHRCCEDMVQLLLNMGASPHITSLPGPNGRFSPGMTILHVAVERCHIPCLRKILDVAPETLHQQWGSGNFPCDTPFLTFIRALTKASRPLKLARYRLPVCLRILGVLFDAGADINDADHLSKTALHLLAASQFQRSEYHLYDIVQLLLSRGADKLAEDTDGKLPFQLATSDSLKAILSPETGSQPAS